MVYQSCNREVAGSTLSRTLASSVLCAKANSASYPGRAVAYQVWAKAYSG